MSKTFYVSGIGNRDKFDNVLVILSGHQCLRLISELSSSMAAESGKHHFSLELHGKLDDDIAQPSEAFAAPIRAQGR